MINLYKIVFVFLSVLISFLSFAEVKEAVSLFENVEESVQSAGKVDQNPCDKNKPIDRTVGSSVVEDFRGAQIEISVISMSYAEELFNEMASQPHIPFKYPEDGCYARAHEMSRLLQQKGVITDKVFVEGDLRVETQNSPKGYVEWWYHVAPIVKIKDQGKEELYVFDPSIFDRPVTLKEWVAIQTKHNPDQEEDVYKTRRYNYNPSDRGLDLDNYQPDDLIHMDSTMKRYIRVQEDRLKTQSRN